MKPDDRRVATGAVLKSLPIARLRKLSLRILSPGLPLVVSGKLVKQPAGAGHSSMTALAALRYLSVSTHLDCSPAVLIPQAAAFCSCACASSQV